MIKSNDHKQINIYKQILATVKHVLGDKRQGCVTKTNSVSFITRILIAAVLYQSLIPRTFPKSISNHNQKLLEGSKNNFLK